MDDQIFDESYCYGAPSPGTGRMISHEKQAVWAALFLLKNPLFTARQVTQLIEKAFNERYSSCTVGVALRDFISLGYVAREKDLSVNRFRYILQPCFHRLRGEWLEST